MPKVPHWAIHWAMYWAMHWAMHWAMNVAAIERTTLFGGQNKLVISNLVNLVENFVYLYFKFIYSHIT